MGWNDITLILATIAGPILAVQAQKWIERWREVKTRQEQVFKTLMSTRGAAVSQSHVQALNTIDLEFQGDKNKPIRTAWRVYLDHLNNYPKGDPASTQGAIDLWHERRVDLLASLLQAMGASLGYGFDEVDIKRGAYVPTAHNEDESEWRALRRVVLETFAGQTPLKMEVTGLPTDPDAIEAHRVMIEKVSAALKDGVLSVDIKAKQ